MAPGALAVRPHEVVAFGGAGLLALGAVLALGPIKGAIVVGVLVGAGASAWAVLTRPILGLHLVLAISWTALGIKRILRTLPLGLAVDAALLLLVLAVLLRPDVRQRLGRLQDLAIIPVLAWMGFCTLQLANPEARSYLAWLYAVRGIGAYMLLPLVAVVVIDHKKQLYALIAHWGGWASLAGLWGIKQSHYGVMAFEQRWLDAGAATTHILFGQLRAFSFLADTAQFGVAMAESSLFFFLLATAPAKWWVRLACVGVGAVCFYGCMVSGTRSAWAVVPVGILVYAAVQRRWAVVIASFTVVALAFGILRFTYIGQGNYHVQRMRTATRPMEDASFQVRLRNQMKLKPYLEDHPFGGGIGSAGSWGQRFSPGTFLADLAMDSHYVRIAAELGPVGFVVFAITMGSLGLIGFFRAGSIEDPVDRVIFAGHLGVFAGVFVASYSNQYLTQIPTAVIVYQGFMLIIGYRVVFRRPEDVPVDALTRLQERRRLRHALSSRDEAPERAA